ncbi:hypothetical protein MK805_00075 [Shimazuella sp. AN120528]|uniref:hypothetical protein n=1 Tax=Shimazuella soli TaxID=1892854 RepID=UPI001F10E967|nr:hypothetical protein [Shimazuella soli]MCH5583377.1 hypothetical protein [Shimazuella soli]
MKQADDVMTIELRKLRGNAHAKIFAIFADRFSGEIVPLSIHDLCPSGDIFEEVKKYCLEKSPILEKDTSELVDLRIKNVYNVTLASYFHASC